MDNKPKIVSQTQAAQAQYPRKIGYVAYRLGDLKTTPATKPAPKQKPHVISDWASI